MYEFWYDYIKPKYQNMQCYVIWIQILYYSYQKRIFYEDIASDVEERFDTSNYEVNRPLSTGKNNKVIGLMKDELGGSIMTEFDALRPKAYLYLIDDCNSDAFATKINKKAKGTKRCVLKRILKFNDYKDSLFKNEIILKSQQRFKSEALNV